MVPPEEREKLTDRHVAVQLGVKMDVRTKSQMRIASIAACRKSQWEIQLERLKRVEGQLFENPMPAVEGG